MPLVLMDVVENLLQVEPEGSWAEADHWQGLPAGLHRPLVNPAGAHLKDIAQLRHCEQLRQASAFFPLRRWVPELCRV
jgi:hypothetical protein